MADEGSLEDYPAEITEYLTGFLSSVTSVQSVIQTLISVSKGDHLKVVLYLYMATANTFYEMHDCLGYECLYGARL